MFLAFLFGIHNITLPSLQSMPPSKMKAFLITVCNVKPFALQQRTEGEKAYEKRLVVLSSYQKKIKKSELVLSQIIIRDATLGLLIYNWKEYIALWTIRPCYQNRTWKKKIPEYIVSAQVNQHPFLLLLVGRWTTTSWRNCHHAFSVITPSWERCKYGVSLICVRKAS